MIFTLFARPCCSSGARQNRTHTCNTRDRRARRRWRRPCLQRDTANGEIDRDSVRTRAHVGGFGSNKVQCSRAQACGSNSVRDAPVLSETEELHAPARTAEIGLAVPAVERSRSEFGQCSGVRGQIRVKQSAVLACAGVRFERRARRTRAPRSRGATRAGARGREMASASTATE